MWATPFMNTGWTSLQQVNFQNASHNHVDWASLAKQWIAQREAVDFTPKQAVNPPPLPFENVVPPPLPPEGDQNEMEISDEENDFYGPPVQMNNSACWDWNETPSWESPQNTWNMQYLKRPSSFDYNQEQVPFLDSYYYNRGSESFRYSQPKDLPPADFDNQFWRAPPPYIHAVTSVGRHPIHQRSIYYSPSLLEMDDSGVDAQKQKQLPAWIREGLEKMEREKQKKEEKDHLWQQEEKAHLNLKQEEKKAASEIFKKTSRDPIIPKKSRFDSDGEDKIADRTKAAEIKIEAEKISCSPKQGKNEEEKQMEMMNKVRKWMMEILLEVTNQEIEIVAKDYKAQNQTAKAPARQLAKSSALASLSTLGLGCESDSVYSESNSDADLKDSKLCREEAFQSKVSSDHEEYKPEDEAKKQAVGYLKNSDRHPKLFHNKYVISSKKDHADKHKEEVSCKFMPKKSDCKIDSGNSSVDSYSSFSDLESISSNSSNILDSGNSDFQLEGKKHSVYGKKQTHSNVEEHGSRSYKISEITERELPKKELKVGRHREKLKYKESHSHELEKKCKNQRERVTRKMFNKDQLGYEKRNEKHRHEYGDNYGDNETNSSNCKMKGKKWHTRSKHYTVKSDRIKKEYRVRDKYKSRYSRGKFKEYKDCKYKINDRHSDYDQDAPRRESDQSNNSSRSKSRKKRKHSRSSSLDYDYERWERRGRDDDSYKHSHRDEHRGGKKSSQKHKSRSYYSRSSIRR